jgi:hypothetical protein
MIRSRERGRTLREKFLFLTGLFNAQFQIFIDKLFSECEDEKAISSQLSAISKRNFLMRPIARSLKAFS